MAVIVIRSWGDNIATGLIGPAVFAAIAYRLEYDDGWSTSSVVVVVVLALAAAALLVRSLLVGVFIGPDRVRVRRVFSTVSCPRTALVGFDSGSSWVLRVGNRLVVVMQGRRVFCPMVKVPGANEYGSERQLTTLRARVGLAEPSR